MACALGTERDCGECRMCGNGKGGKKMTNFERIKKMNVEELAEFLNEVSKTEDLGVGRIILFDEPCKIGEQYCRQEDFPNSPFGCKDCFKEWLESECDAKC